MQCEPPDLQFYAEVHDLNLEFLELIVEARQAWGGSVFGLDTAVVEQIGSLRASQIEAIAATPCLLVSFASRRPVRSLALVAEPRPGADFSSSEHVRLFAAALWTYIWQMARRDALRSALCAGIPQAAQLGTMSFRDMRSSGEQALQYLEARFHRGRFWPDVVHAARDGDPERLRLARLSTIQLATSEAKPHHSYVAGLATPRGGSVRGLPE